MHPRLIAAATQNTTRETISAGDLQRPNGHVDDCRWMSPAIERLLVCPDCRGDLRREHESMTCLPCGTSYPLRDGQIDLRPQRPIHRTLELEFDPPDVNGKGLVPTPVQAGPYAPIEYPEEEAEFSHGNGLTPTLTTYIPTAHDAEDVMLDLGCGDSRKGGILARARGFNLLSVDYEGETPQVLLDAHALPLRADSISVVVSFAVLEHVRVPRIVVSEIARILRPGAPFIGTVAFLESFHLDSYFHHTYLGLQAVLREARLELVGLESNLEWTGPVAIHEMTRPGEISCSTERYSRGRLYRRLHKRADRMIQRVLPTVFGFSRRQLLLDPGLAATVTGGFRFIAVKPKASA